MPGFRIEFGGDIAHAAVGEKAVHAAEVIGVVFMNGGLQVDQKFHFRRIVGLHPVDGVIAGFDDGERLGRAVGDVGQRGGARPFEDTAVGNDGDVVRELPGLRSLQPESAVILRKARAAVDLRDFFGQLRVVRAVPRFVEAVLGVKRGLIQKREEQDAPTVRGANVVIGDKRRRECAENIVVVVQREADLFQVVLALRPQ